ncbi:MAG TPA: hypothetical protein VH854_10620 [Thermoanaerobaculia bacterium]|jgi:hypothetical protein|nr:hypothetical protein [Thermoanaerobaculia bacterium]
MQIPYDIEFVENRPLVVAKAVALQKPPSAWLGAGRSGEQDVVDAILRWAHRLVQRMDDTRRPR